MGTTLTALDPDRNPACTIGHVGDSRAYLLRDGELRQLTLDHSLVEELVREGRLTEEQAAVHPQRSIITRALGVDASVEVDVYTLVLAPGDRLLLCSDGLTGDGAEPTEIAAILRRESDPTARRERCWSTRRTRPAARTTSRRSWSTPRPTASTRSRPRSPPRSVRAVESGRRRPRPRRLTRRADHRDARDARARRRREHRRRRDGRDSRRGGRERARPLTPEPVPSEPAPVAKAPLPRPARARARLAGPARPRQAQAGAPHRARHLARRPVRDPDPPHPRARGRCRRLVRAPHVLRRVRRPTARSPCTRAGPAGCCSGTRRSCSRPRLRAGNLTEDVQLQVAGNKEFSNRGDAVAYVARAKAGATRPRSTTSSTTSSSTTSTTAATPVPPT